MICYDYKGQVESTHFAGNQHGECNGGMCLMFDVLGFLHRKSERYGWAPCMSASCCLTFATLSTKHLCWQYRGTFLSTCLGSSHFLKWTKPSDKHRRNVIEWLSRSPFHIWLNESFISYQIIPLIPCLSRKVKRKIGSQANFHTNNIPSGND